MEEWLEQWTTDLRIPGTNPNAMELFSLIFLMLNQYRKFQNMSVDAAERVQLQLSGRASKKNALAENFQCCTMWYGKSEHNIEII